MQSSMSGFNPPHLSKLAMADSKTSRPLKPSEIARVQPHVLVRQAFLMDSSLQSWMGSPWRTFLATCLGGPTKLYQHPLGSQQHPALPLVSLPYAAIHHGQQHQERGFQIPGFDCEVQPMRVGSLARLHAGGCVAAARRKDKILHTRWQPTLQQLHT